MLKRTTGELRPKSAAMMNAILVSLLETFPTVRKAVDAIVKKDDAAWVGWIDDRTDELAETIGNFFQTED